MEKIYSNDKQIRRKATISDNTPVFHVVFFINDEQGSLRKPGKMYKTLAGARKAAQNWVDRGL